MRKEIITFGDIEIEKHEFNHCKNLTLLEDVDSDKILVSSMVSPGEKNHKYFIGYKNDDHKIKPLRLMLPKTSAYVKRYDGETKWMYFVIEDNELLEICNSTWNRVNNIIKKNFIVSPSTIKKILEAKITCYSHQTTAFHDN